MGDPEILYHARSQCQINAMQAGDFDLATRCLDEMRTLSGRLRQPTLLWMSAFKEAGEALMAGDAPRGLNNVPPQRFRSAPTAASPTPSPSTDPS